MVAVKFIDAKMDALLLVMHIAQRKMHLLHVFVQQTHDDVTACIAEPHCTEVVLDSHHSRLS